MEEVEAEEVTLSVFDFLRYVVDLWPAASLDLHRYYGIDVADEAVWNRPWGWLMSRISSLIDRSDASLFVDQIRADRKE